MKKTNYGEYTVIEYIDPGKNLDDVSLMRVYKTLLGINKLSESNIESKKLDPDATINEIKKRYSQAFITIIEWDIPFAFNISFVFDFKGGQIHHMGLVIIEKSRNVGFDIFALICIHNQQNCYNHLKSPFYVTSITSTPAGVELFEKFAINSWPSPTADQKNPKGRHREVAEVIFEKYVCENFPNKESLSFDKKRNVMRSTSEGMGFNTDFYSISRAHKLKYNLFCQNWVSYEHEEDIIQVGVSVWWMKIVQWLYLKYLQITMYLKRDRFKVERPKAEIKEYSEVFSNVEKIELNKKAS